MKQKFTGTKRRNMTGWAFLLPATILIFAMSFYPMIQAFILSFKSGIGNNLVWSGLSNYKRLLGDGVFKTAMVNNFVYLIIQVPVMLILAILLAVLLNKPHLKCKGLFRTAIFCHAVPRWFPTPLSLRHYLHMTVMSTRCCCIWD